MLKEAEHLFTVDKNTKPGDQLSFGNTNKSFSVLAKSKKEPISKEFYVLSLWPDKGTPDKTFKKLPKHAWTSMPIALFHDGGASDNHSEKIANVEWLVKNYYYPRFGFEWKDDHHKSNFSALDKSKNLRKYIMGPKYPHLCT